MYSKRAKNLIKPIKKYINTPKLVCFSLFLGAIILKTICFAIKTIKTFHVEHPLFKNTSKLFHVKQIMFERQKLVKYGFSEREWAFKLPQKIFTYSRSERFKAIF